MTEGECSTLRSLIADAETIVLCCHQNPDGDAMGAMLGWGAVLQQMGKEPLMVVPDQYPDYFEYSEEYFKEFLSDPKNMENLKAEFFIPLMVNKLINDGTATCEVLDTTSKWFGVTYAADREATVERIQKLVDEGVYPNKLF